MTKVLLSKALKKLMKEKPLPSISVTEVAEVAGFRRQSFYYHFPDLYALLKWTLDQELNIHLGGKNAPATWEEGMLKIFSYIGKNRDFCLSAYTALGRETVRNLMGTEVNDAVRTVITGEVAEFSLPEQTITYLTRFFVGGISNILEDWLLGRLDMSPEEIVFHMHNTEKVLIAGYKAK